MPGRRWISLRKLVARFSVDLGGNVAIIFALATLPLITFVGAAVDYGRANSVKVAIQSALNSTSLMLSKEAATDTSTQLQTNADSYFKALFTRPDAKNIKVFANFTSGSTTMVVTVNSEVPTTLLSIIGINKIDLTNTSTSKWGETRLRVALVLDNTGSMADAGKMSALQTATKSLLTQLKNAVTTNGDVYVSIVPFVKDVNLGAANWSSDYIYWGTAAQDPTLSDNNSWDANNGTCSAGSYSNRSSCTSHSTCSLSGYTSQSSCTGAGTCSISGKSTQSSCTSAGACSKSSIKTQSKCASKGYVWTAGIWTTGVWTTATWTANNHNTWNGCIVDRGNSSGPSIDNYDTNVASPAVTIPASLYGAEQYGSCPQPVMGLNYDWTSMTSLVNNMSPAGNTNQAIGLQLGWMSLVGGGPFSVPAMNPNYKYTQTIILLTDGLNTQDRWYTSQNSIDTRQQLTCNNINAAGITLYTIQVNTGNDPTSTLLQRCAGSPGHYPNSGKYFLLTSASQMLNVFTQIGTELSQLRIAQ